MSARSCARIRSVRSAVRSRAIRSHHGQAPRSMPAMTRAATTPPVVPSRSAGPTRIAPPPTRSRATPTPARAAPDSRWVPVAARHRARESSSACRQRMLTPTPDRDQRHGEPGAQADAEGRQQQQATDGQRAQREQRA